MYIERKNKCDKQKNRRENHISHQSHRLLTKKHHLVFEYPRVREVGILDKRLRSPVLGYKTMFLVKNFFLESTITFPRRTLDSRLFCEFESRRPHFFYFPSVIIFRKNAHNSF